MLRMESHIQISHKAGMLKSQYQTNTGVLQLG
jgi:hypothetical protein